MTNHRINGSKGILALAAVLLATGATGRAHAFCASNNARACWQSLRPGPMNLSSTLDVTEGLVCMEDGVLNGAGDDTIHCARPTGSSGFDGPLYMANGAKLPGGVDGIAIFNTKISLGTAIHVLGKDDIVRTYQGDTANWWGHTGFVTPMATTQPIDADAGTSISIVDIAAVNAGWLGGDRHVVMALSTSGMAYTQHGTKWKKHPRLNSLGVTFKALSSQKPSGNSYWLTSAGAIYSAFDMSTLPGPSVTLLPQYPGKIRDLGFPYILTNAGGSATCNPLTQVCNVPCTVSTNQCLGDADRVQMLSSGAWVRNPQQFMNYTPGMPGPVFSPGNGSDIESAGPKNKYAIVDGRSFRGAAGEYFLHFYTNRWYVWIP